MVSEKQKTERHGMKEKMPFDPETQYAVILSSKQQTEMLTPLISSQRQRKNDKE